MDYSDSVDDFLEHFGVKGMHWGKHTTSPDSGGSGGGKSRAELKTLNRAAKTENKAAKAESRANVKAIINKRENDARVATQKADNEIIKARQDRGKFRQDVKTAKATYKVEKREIGKVAAKRSLDKAKDLKYENFKKSISETSVEATNRIIREDAQRFAQQYQAARAQAATNGPRLYGY